MNLNRMLYIVNMIDNAILYVYLCSPHFSTLSFEFFRDTSTKAKNGLKELANNVAKSLAKKAERSDLKKLIKEMESKDQPKTHIQHASFTESHRSHNNSAMMHHNMQGQGQQNQNLSQSQMNRSMHAMDLLDPENSSAANAKRIRSLTADVDILKSDLMKISSLHMDNSRDISDIRNDLENEVKQVKNMPHISI